MMNSHEQRRMSAGPVGVAVVGAGNISKQYLASMTSFPDLKVLVVASRSEEQAAARASEYGVELSGGISTALNHPDVEIVVNLTPPVAHVEVAMHALTAGKNVYNEKPFALDREGALGLLKSASNLGLRLGGAPDSFMGSGLETARQMINDGLIGEAQTCLTLFQGPGPESWHPSPSFYYERGGGPLFDVGPYYLTALIQLWGPVKRVAATGSKSRNKRVIGSGPRAGELIDVQVPTHVGTIIEFEGGQSCQSVFSFDSQMVRKGFTEVTGTEGTISIPDVNLFGGDIRLWRARADEWETIPTHGKAVGRGVGVLEMARAMRAGLPHRAAGTLAYHVLDVMTAIDESVKNGQFVDVASTTESSPLLPDGWDPTSATL